MERHRFDGFLERLRRRLAKLTRQQMEEVQSAVVEHAQRWLCLDTIEAFGRGRLGCPDCSSTHIHRHGYSAGLQRYRCQACGRTFNALTGTPLAHLRLRAKWLPYLQCMLDSLTVRASADRVGVHRNTSFRWRHRFLTRTKHDRPPLLQGIVEVIETYLLESQKGSRHLTRPARRRGGVASTPGITHEHDCILVARDRGGATRDWVPCRGRPSAAVLERCLPPVLGEDVVLVSDGAKAYRKFVKDAQIAHVALNIAAGICRRGPYHLQNANNYHGRFKGWLAPFRGVASRYLPNYLGWMHALDGGRITRPVGLLKAALGLPTVREA